MTTFRERSRSPPRLRSAMQRTLFDLHAGEAFGRYELLLPIARGGMSMVWAARLCGTRGFQKLVAIKTLIAEKGESAMLERMLLEEARLASRIQHPNVAQYLDLGERDGVLYVVMEWIDGEALGAIMRHAARLGGIPLEISVQIVEQACNGLHGAHELRDSNGAPLGLVHCDVSPQNLMIGDNGAVRLIDFGIARATSARAESKVVAGKLAFMSPEQARAEPIDRRADLFSLGIVLYLLTTGRHPFPGKTSADMLRRMVRNVPVTRPSVIHPSYPRALERVVMRAIEHHRDARFGSAAEMLYALTEAFPQRAPEPELGAFVERAAGHALSERRASISAALRSAEARAEARPPDDSASQRIHASVPVPSELARLMSSAATDAPLETRTRAPESVSERPRRKGGLLAAAAVGLAAAVSIVALRSGAWSAIVGDAPLAPARVAAVPVNAARPAANGGGQEPLVTKAELGAGASKGPGQTAGMIVAPAGGGARAPAVLHACSPRAPRCSKGALGREQKLKSKASADSEDDSTSPGEVLDSPGEVLDSPGEVLDSPGVAEENPAPEAAPRDGDPVEKPPSDAPPAKPRNLAPSLTERYGI